jgi:hypothetical protein
MKPSSRSDLQHNRRDSAVAQPWLSRDSDVRKRFNDKAGIGEYDGDSEISTAESRFSHHSLSHI